MEPRPDTTAAPYDADTSYRTNRAEWGRLDEYANELDARVVDMLDALHLGLLGCHQRLDALTARLDAIDHAALEEAQADRDNAWTPEDGTDPRPTEDAELSRARTRQRS